MRRRRLWWAAGTAAVVAAAVTLWVAMSVPTLPLHFWIRDGDGPMPLYRAPDGAEAPVWTAKRMYGQLVVERPATLGDRVRAIVGLSKRPLAGAGFEMNDGAATPSGWREFIVIHTDDGWLPAGTPDPSLAGHWSCGPVAGDIELRADGTMDREWEDGRWGRADDLVVIDTNPAGGARGAKPTQTFLLAPDGRSMRGLLGEVWRKSP